jgi:hypothetical protein
VRPLVLVLVLVLVALAAPSFADPCRGATLDLAAIVAAGTCSASSDNQALPDTVTLTLDPAALVIKSGGTAKAKAVLTNTSDAAVEVHLHGERGSGPASELRDKAGARVDLGPADCGFGSVVDRETTVITLEPHGTASVAVEVEGRLLVARHASPSGQGPFGGIVGSGQPQCKASRTGKVKPGKYALVVHTLAGDVTAAATVR